MEAWGTDISSAYLCAKTSEKVCIRAGPEFRLLSGHLLIIDKALYGLKSSGRQFNHQLQDVLATLSFKQSRVEDSIFIRKSSTRDCYKYIATYVDDLCIVVMDPE